MKVIATVPAFEVVDLELEIIKLSPEALEEGGFRFCVSKETARHGNLYPEVQPGCAAYYAMQYGECPDAAMQRAKERGHEQYWINNCGSTLTSHRVPQYTLFLLKPGQLVEMRGQLLKVVSRGFDHYGFEIVQGAVVA